MQKRTDLVEHLCVYFRDLRQNQQNFLKKQGFTGEIHKKDQNWHKNCIKTKPRKIFCAILKICAENDI